MRGGNCSESGAPLLSSGVSFFAAVAGGLTPFYASILTLSGMVLATVLILIVLEVKKLKKPKKISKRIQKRLGLPQSDASSGAEFESNHPEAEVSDKIFQ